MITTYTHDIKKDCKIYFKSKYHKMERFLTTISILIFIVFVIIVHRRQQDMIYAKVAQMNDDTLY